MKKKGIFISAVILCSAAGFVQGQENDLGVTLDVTYLSSYIWRGFDCYAERHSAIQPSISLDFYGTGFGLKVFSSRANRSGFENSEWLDVALSYRNSLFEGETYAMDYVTGWVYYNYPDGSRKIDDMQEAFVTFFWSNICPAGFVPRYTVACAWPAKSNSTNASDDGGWVHVFGLGYDLTVPGLANETAEQILHLFADVVYNDGIGPPGEAVDHDWSHALFGISTGFDLGNNLTFTPGVYYQLSMDDSVNDDDETWYSLSMTYKF